MLEHNPTPNTRIPLPALVLAQRGPVVGERKRQTAACFSKSVMRV
jgi:hypothetical protein